MWFRAAWAVGLSLLTAVIVAPPLLAQETTRAVEVTRDSDYFGFDLRTEQNVTLNQCEAICLADEGCRAFTYNTKAKWCFLKSDFNALNAFPGAVAGKIVERSGDPDIGAPPALSFLPAHVADEAIAYRNQILAAQAPDRSTGLVSLIAAGEGAVTSGDGRAAMRDYALALRLSPDDGRLWTGLAEAGLGIENDVNGDLSRIRQTSTSAAMNAYLVSRTEASRAAALATLARALAARAMPRPALEGYKASLALVADADVKAAFEDLRAREGFRVVDHTVDADSVTPRVCVQFSEDLAKAGVDYTQFVTVNEGPASALEAKGRQICAEGLRHGNRYRVVLRQGLPSGLDESLAAPVALDVYVRDRAASIRFTGDGFVLPGKARRGIPIVTVNTDVARVDVYRVGERALPTLVSGYNFLRQLDGYDADRIRDELGSPVWTGEIGTKGDLNAEVVTSFPVDEALPDRKPGIYVMTAQPKGATTDTWEARATQWFVVSDIGLTTFTGQDGLTVFARSLGSARPVAGAELTLLARNNELLGTATADADGKALFAPGLTRGDAGMAPAVLTARLADGDFVFLDMTKAGFDLSDRGVEGRAAPGPVDVYLWTERGIYRVGETVHAAALARDDKAAAVGALPLTFIFSRPDGREDRRIVSSGAELGGHVADLALPGNAMRGTWQLRVHTDPEKPAIASTMFLVEDFVPDRIALDLTAADPAIGIGSPAEVDVEGRFLYGAPSSGLSLEGDVRIRAVRERKEFPGYRFGLSDETLDDAPVVPLAALPLTDQDGKAKISVGIDAVPATTRPLEATVTVRMREAGGRAVERQLTLPVAPDGPMIGIRPDFADGALPQGATAGFRVLAVDAAGRRQALKGLQWSLVKIERNYQWYRSGSSWNYEPVTFTRAVSNGTIDVGTDAEALLSSPVEWGRYRLEVATADPSGPATSVEFEAGWYVEAASTETPDGLEIALDKPRYAAGETARLKVSPRFAGELLVAIGTDRLVTTLSATVPAEGATIDIPVGSDWGAGVYVTAALQRPGDAEESRMPLRSVGVAWLGIEPGARRLSVALDTPEKVVPRGPLSIPVSVGGLAPGEEAYVTVAAVDVGILNLTRYEAPDASGWYLGQRAMGLEMRDLYGRLIDGSLGATGRIRTGGDGASMSSQGSPPDDALVAFFSGIVRIGDDGKAAVSFDLPQFNGTVRVMAVAWSKTAVGESARDVVVRDPIVVTATLPQFMAPGDRTELNLDIANTDGPAGDYVVDVMPDDGLAIEGTTGARTVSLAAGARQQLTVPVLATKAGAARLAIRVSIPNGPSVGQEIAVAVRPQTLPVTTRQVVSLKPNGSLRLDAGLFQGSILDGARVTLGISAANAFDVPSLLMSLDRYPYGCAEQTTSRALPLLYVSELSAAAGLEDDPDLRQRVQDAITRVLAYQAPAGSFGLWSPGSGDLWLDAYVTDFLTRAREKDYDVPQAAFRQALDNLRNALAYDVDIEANGSAIAYALYVLARNGNASVGDIRYYADTQLEKFENALARAHLAAALALYGDSERAARAFDASLAFAEEWEVDASRSDYGSELRDGAAMLALAAETTPSPQAVPAMIRYVAETRSADRWLSTQEQAWMLLAARAVASANQRIDLEVDGAAHQGGLSVTRDGEAVTVSPLVVMNRGAEAVDAVVTALAAPSEPLPAGGDGFTIERTYYALDGTPANVTEARQNDRYVVVLKMTEANEWPSRVLVTDLLPAGFQIDNPRIVNSADLASFGWLGATTVAHSEFRTDRFVAAFDRDASSPREFRVAYVVRAVSPGSYAHPAASVEDMYRPEYNARTATGRMEVGTARP